MQNLIFQGFTYCGDDDNPSDFMYTTLVCQSIYLFLNNFFVLFLI